MGIAPSVSWTLLWHRSIVYLEIDNRQCIQSSSQCFQSATDVAAFLGALASLGNLNIPYKIEAVKSKYGWLAGEEREPELPSRIRAQLPVSWLHVSTVCFS